MTIMSFNTLLQSQWKACGNSWQHFFRGSLWIPSKIHCFVNNIGSIYIAFDVVPKLLTIRQVRCTKHLTAVEIWTPTCLLSGTPNCHHTPCQE